MKYIFDEFKQQTIDFTDEKLVANYANKQLTTLDSERELALKIGVQESDRVIEFGPGIGTLSMAMAEICQHVYAVDTSKPMLKAIEQAASTMGINNVSTHYAGFLSYQHEAEPVDLVVTKFTLHHLPDMWKGVAFSNINGLLKINGRFYLHDIIYSFEPHQYDEVIGSWIDRVIQNGGWSRTEFETHVNEEFSTYAWILEGLLRQTGFRIISVNYQSDTYGTIICEKIEEL